MSSINDLIAEHCPNGIEFKAFGEIANIVRGASPRPIQSFLTDASEADLLNMDLFGLTAKQWRDKTPNKEGNIRDYANVSQLVCLANLETLNAHFIQQTLPPSVRLRLLNNTAIQLMRLLTEDSRIKKLERDEA